MNVAVTGSAGQLGSLVLRRLVADRAIKRVVAIDLRPPAIAGSKVHAVTCDVRSSEIARHLADCQAVVHLAFLVTDRVERERYWSVNVDGSKNVFRAAAGAGAKQILYSSSIAAYGVVPGHPQPIVEDTPRVYQPEFPYAATKFEVEAFLDEFERTHSDIAVCRLRPAILIGAHMEHSLGDAFRRRVVVDLGGPIPLVWDEDAADAISLALRKQARGAFNLTADDPLDAAGLATASGMKRIKLTPIARKILPRLAGPLARLGLGHVSDPSWLKAGHAPMIASSRKAREQLGWKPRCATCADVAKHYVDTVPASLDRRLMMAFAITAAMARLRPIPPEARSVSARVHLQLTGPRGGDIALRLDEGRLSLRPGIPRPPTSVVTLRAETLLDLFGGRTDPMAAQLTGRLQLEGDPVGNMVLGTLVAHVRKGVKRFASVKKPIFSSRSR